VGQLICSLIPFLITLIIFVWIYKCRYRKVEAEQVIVLYGRKRIDSLAGKEYGYRLVKSGGTCVMPVVENYRFFSLSSVKPDMLNMQIYDRNNMPVFIDGEAEVQFNDSDMDLEKSVKQLLDKTPEQREEIVREILLSHLQFICSETTGEELREDYRKLVEQLKEYSDKHLSALGMKISFFDIRKIRL